MTDQTEMRDLLTDADLDEVSGGSPNLGLYTACPDGLYVGKCPPNGADLWNAFVTAAGVPQATMK